MKLKALATALVIAGSLGAATSASAQYRDYDRDYDRYEVRYDSRYDYDRDGRLEDEKARAVLDDDRGWLGPALRGHAGG